MNGWGEKRQQRLLVSAAIFSSKIAHKIVPLINKSHLARATIITVWYMTVVSCAYYGAFLLRFDGKIPFEVLNLFTRTLPILLLIRIITFQRFALYSGLLRYVSVDDVWDTMKAIGISTSIFMVVIYAMHQGFEGFPRSVFIIETMLSLGLLTGHRMSLRALREHAQNEKNGHSEGGKKILLIGDLDAADDLLRALKHQPNGDNKILGIVQEDSRAKGKKLRNIKVMGGLTLLPKIVQKYQPNEVLILPPYASSPKFLRDIIERCRNEGNYPCNFQMVPSLQDIAEGKTTVSMIRKVEIEDLLGRPPVETDRSRVRESLYGKAVMVTGAGGSIGSELCRQIAEYQPRLILLYELAEFNLYQIEMDLCNKYPDLKTIPIAGDVCDEYRLARVIQKYGIEIIYHAAAYKHVPLMESNITACVKTNVLGTECVARTAEKFSVKKIVLISSDKAVRPSSVMGASKRLAELIAQGRPPSSTEFVAVRFGNVLGSSGSVIPLFKKQIEKGGPVTITHPDITRFFMSIPEAVDLVLQAATVGNDREIMVLEMGEPVKIVDLATRLIELSGLIPGKDIEIIFTGLRPGEKLYEELLTQEDDIVRTEYKKIWVSRNNGTPTPQNSIFNLADISYLEQAIMDNNEDLLRELLWRFIPENLMQLPNRDYVHANKNTPIFRETDIADSY